MTVHKFFSGLAGAQARETRSYLVPSTPIPRIFLNSRRSKQSALNHRVEPNLSRRAADASLTGDFSMRVDIRKIKNEIHLYGKLLGMRDAKATPAEIEELKKRRNHGFIRRDGSFVWIWREITKCYTRLVALRAHLRGKLHFSPTTNLEEAFSIFDVPCVTYVDHKRTFKPITAEVQAEWVAPLMAEFKLEQEEATA